MKQKSRDRRTNMRILYIGDAYRGDDAFLDRFSKLPALIGHKVSTSMGKKENATEVSLLAAKHNFDAVVTSQHSLLVASLRRLPDFIPSKKQISLDSHAGNMWELPNGIPILIVNSLE